MKIFLLFCCDRDYSQCLKIKTFWVGKDNATPTVFIDNTYHLWERLCGSFDEYFDREQEANFEETKRKLQTEIDSITFMKDSLQRQKEALEGEVSVKTVEVTGLKSTVAELQTAQVGIAAQLDATKVCSPPYSSA